MKNSLIMSPILFYDCKIKLLITTRIVPFYSFMQKQSTQLLHSPKTLITWTEKHHYTAHKTWLHGRKNCLQCSICFFVACFSDRLLDYGYRIICVATLLKFHKALTKINKPVSILVKNMHFYIRTFKIWLKRYYFVLLHWFSNICLFFWKKPTKKRHETI